MTADRFGLYYPGIKFGSDWLRLGALYWPKLARIVPPGFTADDDDDTRALISELDLVLDVAPDAAAARVAAMFLELLRRHGGELVRSYWFDPSAVQHVDWSDPWLAEVHTARGIHRTKVDSAVREAMTSLGLASEADGLAPWLLLESRLAHAYMCVLADEIARLNPVLQPVTDFPGFYIAGSGWTLDRLVYALLAPGPLPEPGPGAEQADTATAIGLLALEMVVPVAEGRPAWAHPPIEKIIEIRRRYGADFVAFRQLTEAVAAEVADELGQVRDPAVLDSYLRYLAETRLVRPAADLRKAMRGLRLDVATQAVTLKLEVPALAGMLAGSAVAHQPVLAGGSAIAAGLLGLRLAARRGRAAAGAPSAASYLVSVHEDLTPHSRVRELADGFRRVAASPLRRADRGYLGGAL